MKDEVDYFLDYEDKQSTTARVKAWFTQLLREQSSLIKTAADNSEKAAEEAHALWLRSQQLDESAKVRRGNGWKLFKRVIGTVLKDGEDLIK